jgi:hypothetical protein
MLEFSKTLRRSAYAERDREGEKLSQHSFLEAAPALQTAFEGRSEAWAEICFSQNACGI